MRPLSNDLQNQLYPVSAMFFCSSQFAVRSFACLAVWFFLSFAVVLSVKFNYSASSDKRGLDEGVPAVEREAWRLFEQLPWTNTARQWPANEVSVAQKKGK